MRRLAAVAVVAVLLAGALPVFGQAAPRVVVDGQPVAYDVPPTIVNDRVLVPLRLTFEALGAAVSWDGGRQMIFVWRLDTALQLTVGKAEMVKNGEVIPLDVAPFIDRGRTLVPLRAVAEGLGARVEWDAQARTVRIARFPDAVPSVAAEGLGGGLQRLRAVPGGLLGIIGTRLFQSADGGRTWQELASPTPLYQLSDALRLPDGTLFAATGGGPLHRSGDGGRTWSVVSGVAGALGLHADGNTLYVAGTAGAVPAIYQSADGGRTWTFSSQGLAGGRAQSVAVDAADKNLLYAGLGDYDLARLGGGLYRSTDGGRTWTHASRGLPGWVTAVVADPRRPGHAYARTPEGLFATADAGETWSRVPGRFWLQRGEAVNPWDLPVLGLTPSAVAHDKASQRLVAVAEGAVFTAGPGGEWEQGGQGLPPLWVTFAPPYAVAGNALFRDGRFVAALPARLAPLAVDPGDPGHLWLLPGYESRDGGRTWQRLGSDVSLTGPALALDARTLLAGGMRSGDGGRTWERSGLSGARALARGAGGRAWAATGRGVYVSDDGGRTWRWEGRGLPSQSVHDISPDPDNPLLAVAATEGGVACTRDGGARWYACMDGLPAPPYRASIRLSRSPAGTLFLVHQQAGVFLLYWGTWKPVQTEPLTGVQAVAALPGGEIWIVAHPFPQQRRLSEMPVSILPQVPPPPAAGPRWTGPSLGEARAGGLLTIATDPNAALAADADGRLHETRDGGRTWTRLGSLPRGAAPSTLVGVPDGRYLFAGGYGAVYRSADGGRTWETIPLDALPSAQSPVFSADPVNPEVVVLSYTNALITGGHSGVLRSTDGGRTWARVYAPAREEGRPLRRVGNLVRSDLDPDLLYVSGDLLVVSRDGGLTWQEMGAATVQATDPRDVRRLYGSQGGRLAISADGGLTWQPVAVPAGISPNLATLRPDPQRPERLYLTSQGDGGLWVSQDGGRTWTDVAASLGSPQVAAMTPAGPDAWYVYFANGLMFRLDL